MIVMDMPEMAQFVYDFYNQKIDMLMIQKDLPQVKLHCYVLIQIVEPSCEKKQQFGFTCNYNVTLSKEPHKPNTCNLFNRSTKDNVPPPSIEVKL